MGAGSIAAPALLLLASYARPDATLSVVQYLFVVWGVLAVVDAMISWARAHTNAKFLSKTTSTPRLALVTGASAGLGKEIATLLAAKGYALLLVARREARLQTLQRDLQQLTSVSVTYVVADLATPDGVQRVIDHVHSHKLEVDVIINNAGASVRGELVSLSAAQVENILQLNVAAATKLTHALVPGMVARRRGGNVLVVSSMAGEIPNPLAAVYGASKAYLTKFAQATNYEVRGTGVRVTAFLPGPLHTEFGDHAQCQSAIYMRLPGRATPRACAEAAIAAMESETVALAFDNCATWLMATVMGSVLPRTLSTTLAGLSMEDPMALVDRIMGRRETKRE